MDEQRRRGANETCSAASKGTEIKIKENLYSVLDVEKQTDCKDDLL